MAAWVAMLIPAGADDVLVGVGITNISWQQAPAISSTLDAISEARFEAVRIAWKGSIERSQIALRDASTKGLETLIVLPLTDGPTSEPEALARQASGDFFAVHGLSRLDLTRLEAQVDDMLDFVVAEDIAVAGIELGNELNWSGFNGDLPLAPSGAWIEAMSQLDAPTQQAFARGVDRYVEAIRLVEAALRARDMDVPVVLGAMADIDGQFVRQSGGMLVAPDIVVAMLEARGALALTDAVAVHLYAPLRLDVETDARAGMLGQVLDDCGTPALGGQPCWITEYGIAQWQDACDVSDEARRDAIAALNQYLSQPGSAARVPATFFYDWSDSAHFSLVRCGRLSTLAQDVTGGINPS